MTGMDTQEYLISWGFLGAGEGTRTLDILLGRQTLYQLSYSRTERGEYSPLQTTFPISHVGCQLPLGEPALESIDRNDHCRGRPAEPQYIRWHRRSGSAVSTRPPSLNKHIPQSGERCGRKIQRPPRPLRQASATAIFLGHPSETEHQGQQTAPAPAHPDQYSPEVARSGPLDASGKGRHLKGPPRCRLIPPLGGEKGVKGLAAKSP